MLNNKIKSSGKFGSMRSRLLFWFIAISILPLLVMVWGDYNSRRSALINLASKRLTVIRKLKEEQLKNWMVERFGDISLMASNKVVRKCDELRKKGFMDEPQVKIARDKTRADIMRILNGYLIHYSAYEDFSIIDPTTGKVTISTKQKMIGENKRYDPYFTGPMKTRRIYVKSIYFSNTLHRKTMAISVPIFSKKSNLKINGILVARLDISNSIEPLFQSRTGLGETGEILVLNSQGSILLNSRKTNNGPIQKHLGSPAVLKALRGETDVVITKDYRGKRVLASYSYLPFLKWGVIAKQDIHDIEAPLRNTLSTLAIVSALSLVFVLILAIVLARAIASPVIALSEDAKLIGQGDLTIRHKITTHDEIATLGKVFNVMVEDVEKQFNLQQQIALIRQAIVGIDKVAKFADEIIEKLSNSTKAHGAVFFIRKGKGFLPLKSIGMDTQTLTSFKSDSHDKELGLALSKKQTTHFKEIPEDTRFIHKSVLGSIIPKELIAFPLIVDNDVQAMVFLLNVTPFSKETLILIDHIQPTLNAAFTGVMAHEKLERMSDARKRLNEQLLTKSDEVRAQSDELRRQNLELEMQKTRLQELSRLKGEFLSNMSHELRTPLNSILALSKVMLEMDDVDGDKREYLTVVERNGGRLLELINNILELSKLESGSVMLRPARFHVKTVLEDCVEMLRPLARAKHISLKTSISQSREVFNDPTQLRCILQNLIGNAIKFTEKGGVEVNVALANEQVEIKVIDTGNGIPEDQLPNIFDEFRQIDGSSSRKHEGTGLGLAIAKKAATLIGGTINVTSKINVGTCFTLLFPTILGDDEEYVDNTDWTDDKTPHPSETELSKSLAGKSMLLVDDNEIVQVQVKNIIKNEDVSLRIAKNGKEALKAVKESIPDAIILDLMMPEMDGFEVLNNIRATKETADIPVLILTAQEVSESAMRNLKNNHIKQLVHKGNINAKQFLKAIRLLALK